MSRLRVLWVDSDVMGVLQPLLVILTRSGLDVQTAPDMVTALHRLEKETFDAFLLEVIIPYTSSSGSLEPYGGIRLARRIRDLEVGNPAQIVFFSVVHIDEVLDAMRDVGAKFFDKTSLFSHGEIDALVSTLKGTYSKHVSDLQMLLLALREGKFQILPATCEGIYRVRMETPGKELLLSSPHIIASSTRAYLVDKINEFEDIINSPHASEHDLQRFLELNPTFLLGQEYESLHPHLVLEREEDEGALVPDFLLRPFNSDLCDIIELKKPTRSLLVGSANRLRFSSAVAEAAAQLRTYRRYFDDPRNREKTKLRYGVTSYLPRLAVIIGRRMDVDPLILRTVRDDEKIDVITYDDLLDRAKRFKIG